MTPGSKGRGGELLEELWELLQHIRGFGVSLNTSDP